MLEHSTNDALLDMFLFETAQLLEQLEQSILSSEKEGNFSKEAINEIFRIMHTIKGSASMMIFNNIASLAHSMEDLFFFLREEKPLQVNCPALCDIVFQGIDFIKVETEKIKNKDTADGNSELLIEKIQKYLTLIKCNNISCAADRTTVIEQADPKLWPDFSMNSFKAVIHFEEGCEMENIRAFTIVHKLDGVVQECIYIPEDIIDNDGSIEIIKKDGFQIYMKTRKTYQQINEFFLQTLFLKHLDLMELDKASDFHSIIEKKKEEAANQVLSPLRSEVHNRDKDRPESSQHMTSSIQSIISVSVPKLDKLMDLVGEMVIAEAMVIQNPDLNGMELTNFRKAAGQLNKITSEIQDMVMSIRMVPLSISFNKMHRIVRDMCKKLDKEVQLKIIGEETEVDKNIIEHISDPLMHLVRNAIDHGIETGEERQRKGKSKTGTITLEAKNAGSDVVIIVKDDGKGLNREKILKKARDNGLLNKKDDEITDKEAFQLILLPGFSTKESVTEFSGRGVGMDVVLSNMEMIGGSLSVDSVLDQGTTITLKLPLTLAIIDGMNIKVGNSCYTIPTISIKEFFRPKDENIITDPDGNEMIMVRGHCYHMKRLYELYRVDTNTTRLSEGIIIMLEQDEKTVCIFVDELLGQQQVVVKALPEYLQRFKKVRSLAGCTLLGDGSISLILDVDGLLH
ncbi:MAG: chemotaxis protein CheA [Herbinix sp.]|nr:chemotaxis protein CheA [Herbinix sp.]